MITITPIDSAAVGESSLGTASVPLSDRFTAALAESYVWAGTERDAVLRAANDPTVAADPQRLYELQLRQESYAKRISVGSALTSHFTKGVETLLKS